MARTIEVTAHRREQLDHRAVVVRAGRGRRLQQGRRRGAFLSAVGYCVSMVSGNGIDEPACMGAVEDYLACLAELDCDELVGGNVDANPGSRGELRPTRRRRRHGPDAGSDTEPGDGGGAEGEAVEVHERRVQLDAIAAQCAFFGGWPDTSDSGAEPDPDMGGSDGG
ncbi:MAG: hypothetical protein U0168_24900 [Nannocystaceae bacterium]